MTTETTTRRPIRSYGHARAILQGLEHVPSMFGPHNGRVGSRCAACGLWAYVAGNALEGEAVEARCPASGWEEEE